MGPIFELSFHWGDWDILGPLVATSAELDSSGMPRWSCGCEGGSHHFPGALRERLQPWGAQSPVAKGRREAQTRRFIGDGQLSWEIRSLWSIWLINDNLNHYFPHKYCYFELSAVSRIPSFWNMFFFADLWNLQESAIIFDWDDTLFPTWHRYGMRCVTDIMWTQDDERPSFNY